MKVVVNSQMVNYTDEGKGKAILMLHGWGASLRSFDGIAYQLSKDYRVIRLDFPGFGGSSQPPKDWEISDYVQLVGAFLQKLKIEEMFAVITHSFGGRVIIKMLALGHQNPERIILIDSGGIRQSGSLRNQGFKIVAKTGKQLTKLPGLRQFHSKLRRRLYESAGSTDYIEAGELQQTFLRVINEDVRELAAKITQPTLIIWGKDDTETPLSDGEILHSKIKSSRLIVIPGAGHFAHIDQPAKVMQQIEDFLK